MVELPPLPPAPPPPSLPPLPRPYPHLRVGTWGADALPEGVGTVVDLARGVDPAGGGDPAKDVDQAADVDRAGSDEEPVNLDQTLAEGLDCVVVSAAGSSHRINVCLLEVLTACETAGIPTVLRAAHPADLDSPVAAVVSHVALETEELYQQGLRQVGPERAFLITAAVDPLAVLTEAADDPGHATAEAAKRRRRILAERSPQAQADRFVRFLGLPVEPEPLVTALIVSRHAKNLHYSLQNLKRQNYARLDPLLVIDPLYEQDARQITADWDIPLRIVVANPRSSPADKLNVGIRHAHGEVVAVIEETGLYGSRYLTDQVQALQASGAHLVGKASWFVWNDQKGKPTLHAGAKQRSFDHVPVLGTLALYRDTATSLGFTRRVSSVEGALARRIHEAGGRVYVADAFDTVLLRRGQTLEDFAAEVPSWEVFRVEP